MPGIAGATWWSCWGRPNINKQQFRCHTTGSFCSSSYMQGGHVKLTTTPPALQYSASSPCSNHVQPF